MSAPEHSPANRAGAPAVDKEAWSPGPGWREVSSSPDADVTEVRHWDAETEQWRYWVPGDPVPSLPSAPMTVIDVTWAEGHRVAPTIAILHADATWSVGALRIPTDQLPLRITGFKVRAEPVEDAS